MRKSAEKLFFEKAKPTEGKRLAPYLLPPQKTNPLHFCVSAFNKTTLPANHSLTIQYLPAKSSSSSTAILSANIESFNLSIATWTSLVTGCT